jgi:hypothetical protein
MGDVTQAVQSKALTVSRVVVNIVWYLSLFALILALGLAILMQTTEFGVAFVRLPVTVNIEDAMDGSPRLTLHDKGSLPIWGFENLRVEATTLPGLSYSMVMPVILLFGLLWILYHLRELLRALTRVGPFAPENPGRIRRIGWALVAAGPVFGLFMFLYGTIYVHFLDIPGAQIEVPIDVHPFVILTGLIVLVISQVFEMGVRLQREQDLTV